MPGDTGAQQNGGGQGPVGNMVDGISCDTVMSNNYHVHALRWPVRKRYAGGDSRRDRHRSCVGRRQRSLSGWPNQEIYGDCFYHIHTHDDTGLVHLEDPNVQNLSIQQSMFTTGNLFDIWGVSVGAMQFGPFSGPVTVHTSGQFSRDHQCFSNGICEVGANMYQPWTGDPAQIPLYSHEVIWYEVGSGNPDAMHLPGVSFAIAQ